MSHLGADKVQARRGVLRGFWGVSSRHRCGAGQSDGLGRNPAGVGRVLPGHRSSAGQRGGLTWAQTWCRPGGGLRGSWGGLGGLTCAQTRCSPAAMAVAGPSQRNTWHFSTCVKGSRATYAKSLAGRRGVRSGPPGPLPTQSEPGLGALGIWGQVGAIPLPVSPAAQQDRAGLGGGRGGTDPSPPQPQDPPHTTLGAGLKPPHTLLCRKGSVLRPHGSHLPN